MSVTTVIRGIPVQFPFKPYDIQIDYMEKVIECLETESTAVLESPTGTGKTLSLLCSSLAWLQQKKLQIQAQRKQTADKLSMFNKQPSDIEMHVQKMTSGRELLGLPTIIYASRTHSQLSQAVQELKRSAYNNMCCTVLGSRDQLCIHPEVMAESDRNLRLHMCRLKLASHACHYNNRVESRKEMPEISQATCLDIEDMVSMGKKHIFCPYYMTKERRGEADIIFTPYNYLLDPLSRKSLGCHSGLLEAVRKNYVGGHFSNTHVQLYNVVHGNSTTWRSDLIRLYSREMARAEPTPHKTPLIQLKKAATPRHYLLEAS